MYRGFNLKTELINGIVDQYRTYGLSTQEKYKENILSKFRKVVENSHQLDAAEIESLFFPQIDADIFISHSHRNANEVMALAGFLNQEFDLKVFVDSCIWESAKTLQRILDNTFSWTDYEKKVYSYDAVGKSSSHAHMMLSVALSKMLNTTECIFFYNKPESITPYGESDSTTSPWIYTEIALTHILPKKIPERRLHLYTKLMSERRSINESFDFFYPVDLSHFATINDQTFKKWIHKSSSLSPMEVLDALYDMIPLPKN
ncbi:MAG: hypothetical protein ACT6QS_00255 [Flavobacteriales bacterium]